MSSKKKRKLSLASKIIIGALLGILVGLFFGEWIQPLSIVGEIFIMLLQMPVLPYVFLSLIVGIGSFNVKEGGKLLGSLAIIMVSLWVITLIGIILMPLTFPDWASGSFFSSNLVADRKSFNFLTLYIPTNPFHALSNSVVPAVVLFSIVLGIALSNLPNKDYVIKVLNPLVDALGKITNWVVELAPVGVFALVAGLAGTMDPEMLIKLEVFIWNHGAMALLLSLWVLPGLISTFTGIKYSRIIRESKDALVTAFATGNLFVVLPMLSERSKNMLKDLTIEGDESVDVIVPVGYSFPSSGKLLTLSFVLFAGWFSGFEVTFDQYPTFMLAGTFSFFGSTVAAIPFMLDLMQIPSDLLQLFLSIDNIIINRFGSLLAAAFILVLAILGTASVTGSLKFDVNKILKYLIITLILVSSTIIGLRFSLGLIDAEYTRDKELVQMFIARHIAPSKVYLDSIPSVMYDPNKTRLGNIRNRGYIRVGFFRDHLPSAFINASGDLVGSDIEMAHLLASDLGVSLEFILIDKVENVRRNIQNKNIDILMTGTELNLDWVDEIAYTIPYQDQTLAFLVKDYNRSAFSSMESIRSMDSLRIGIGRGQYYTKILENLIPNAEIIQIASPRVFVRDTLDQFDALAYTAESGGAWSILYPEFSVAVPQPITLKIPQAYVVSKDDQEFLNFIDTWIYLKKTDGSFESALKYWEMGGGTQEIKEPRWSVIRNVLHWVD